eukprot:1179684-Prorocentrum_minimum.AAC.2
MTLTSTNSYIYLHSHIIRKGALGEFLASLSQGLEIISSRSLESYGLLARIPPLDPLKTPSPGGELAECTCHEQGRSLGSGCHAGAPLSPLLFRQKRKLASGGVESRLTFSFPVGPEPSSGKTTLARAAAIGSQSGDILSTLPRLVLVCHACLRSACSSAVRGVRAAQPARPY